MKRFYGLIFGLLFLTTSCFSSSDDSDTKFQFAMKTVLLHEGGLSNDKADPGGETNFGISLRFIKDEHLDINGDGKVDKNDIIHLTQSEADKIYFADWWIKNHYDKIKDKYVATKIMDFSVNAGSSRAHRIAKQALNSIHGKYLKVDGILDEKTIAMINATEPGIMMDALRSEEAKYYRDIVKKNPSLAPFEKGWQNRAKF